MCSFVLLFPPSGSLMYLNEATLLNNVRVRYNKDLIYVCLLLCAKPLAQINLYMYVLLKGP